MIWDAVDSPEACGLMADHLEETACSADGVTRAVSSKMAQVCRILEVYGKRPARDGGQRILHAVGQHGDQYLIYPRVDAFYPVYYHDIGKYAARVFDYVIPFLSFNWRAEILPICTYVDAANFMLNNLSMYCIDDLLAKRSVIRDNNGRCIAIN